MTSSKLNYLFGPYHFDIQSIQLHLDINHRTNAQTGFGKGGVASNLYLATMSFCK